MSFFMKNKSDHHEFIFIGNFDIFPLISRSQCDFKDIITLPIKAVALVLKVSTSPVSKLVLSYSLQYYL